MGKQAKANAARKAKLLMEHPTCCYCGNAPAVEVDHCPARVFFAERVAPDGYEFPACHRCNQNVRNVEQVVACFTAMRLDGSSKDEDILKRFKHAINNMPGLGEELRATAFSARPIPPSRGSEDVVVRETGPIVTHCIDVVGHKLTLALYYKHMSRPLHGFVFCRMTPKMVHGGMLDAASASMLSPGPIERNRVDLSEQFRYEFTGGADGFFAAAIRMGDQLAYLSFAVPSELWRAFRRDHPDRANELEKFGRPDIFEDWTNRSP